jgi:hypothetical protein
MGREASRIAYFIRYQRTKNVLLGDKDELRKAMESALAAAAEGNWHLIGGGKEYASMAITRRRKRIIRRAISIGIAILGAIAAQRLMPTPYGHIVVLTCLWFAGLEVLGLISPDAPSQLDIASRFASIFNPPARTRQ